MNTGGDSGKNFHSDFSLLLWLNPSAFTFDARAGVPAGLRPPFKRKEPKRHVLLSLKLQSCHPQKCNLQRLSRFTVKLLKGKLKRHMSKVVLCHSVLCAGE